MANLFQGLHRCCAQRKFRCGLYHCCILCNPCPIKLPRPRPPTPEVSITATSSPLTESSVWANAHDTQTPAIFLTRRPCTRLGIWTVLRRTQVRPTQPGPIHGSLQRFHQIPRHTLRPSFSASCFGPLLRPFHFTTCVRFALEKIAKSLS